uniref:Band 4.1-like protein 3 isoform X3 n=1 Tax=Crassostrea virginica TaxID=6565 RepID=A0A8B8DSE2_CRAVI|nr:band 4.1-like protein 3 isoform X3 [Crassostrea virginica]
MGDNRRMPQVRTARPVICRVLLLDGKQFEIDVDKRAVGQILFDKVCEHLDLLEKDYFGLSFNGLHTGLREWLNVEKKISKQMKGLAWEFKFEVKFYPPDPQSLHEDLTRYQLCLQIRNDIVNEKLPCSAVTYALLGSYTVQSELGDFDIDEFGPGTEYIRKMRFAPHQDRELLKKIAELHKTHRGQTPEEAELHFLENAKKLAMYGVDISDAKDGENVDIQLGVCWNGILVFREKLQINKFVWPKILKMSYRRKKFYIKLRTGEFEEFQSLIGFKFSSSRHAKRMWKICVENHAFFRNREPDSPGTQRGLLRLGSKFRYSGRTHFQTKQAMMGVDRPSPYFDRMSKRATYHGKTKNRELSDEMFKPRPEPRHFPEYNREEKMMKKIPEPEIHEKENKEDVFDDEEEEEEEPDNRKSRMEKIHAVPTPLAAVMTKKDTAENNNHREHHRRRRSFEETEEGPGVEDEMERSVEPPPPQQEPLGVHDLPSPPLDPPQLLSKEERKKREKEEKERKKREKEEQKKKKKEEEKEKKRLAKEKKKKPAVEEKWQEAVAVSATTDTIVMDRPPPRRMSSFEEQKEDKPEPREAEEQEGKTAEDSGSNEAAQGSEGEGDPTDQQPLPTKEVTYHTRNDEDVNRSTDRVGEEFDL